MTSRFRKKLRVLRRHLRKGAMRGSAALEFAFIAPVFFALLLGIIETGVLFFGQSTLQFSTQQAGRLIRTGIAQATTPGSAAQCAGGAGGTGAGGSYLTSQEWFKDQICCGISAVLPNCTANLHVAVQNYTAGFGTSFTNSTDANGNLVAVADAYNPGSPCDVVLLRATYNWTVVTPVLSWFLVNMTGGMHLMSATAAFRNEPYTSGSAC